MQDIPTSDTPRRGQHPCRATASRAATRLARGLIYLGCYLSGAATGTSLIALLLYQSTDWRWAWLGLGGLLGGACSVRLIAYFPRREEVEP